MATFRLSRSLVGIFALSCFSMSASIVGFSTFIASNTSMAKGLVPAAATACVRPSPPASRGLIQDVTGTLQSISGQTLHIVNPKNTPPSINATYSSTTHIIQETSVTTAALKQGANVFIQATQNANSTYTATAIMLMQGDQPPNIDCSPDGGPSRLSSPPAGGRPLPNRGCFPGGGPGAGTPRAQDNNQSTCIVGTIQQLNGTTLTVKDRQANAYTITLTKTTTLTQNAVVPATVLKPNTLITVIGPNNNGVIAAFNIILHP